MFCLYLGFLLFCFSKANTLILGTPKDYISPLSLQGQSQKGWVQFLVRILKVVIGGSRCVVFMSFVLSYETMMSRKYDCVFVWV